ncbi:heterokaryon incompatibility protein-domain-containing protein [Whalleya microplaca]|nr:heterokaryon incompatibility protein-domain-containing protein [Whalleya microplaca]
MPRKTINELDNELVIPGLHGILGMLNSILGRREIMAQKWWIKHCLENHPACQPRVSSRDSSCFLPTRLVDVRSYPKIRLVLKEELPEDSAKHWKYTALSYCWGNSMPEEGKTTQKTLDARRKSIHIAQLPPTLRDAIKLTHNLGVPFVWIDSLCILQLSKDDKDDNTDWNYEPSTMSQVYSRAYVTIAAAVGNHCGVSFLRTSYTDDDIVAQRNSLTLLEGYYDKYAWLISFNRSPLLTRGWTLQERELSPRILHFTRMYVIWECHEYVCFYLRPLRPWSTPRVQLGDLGNSTYLWRFRCFDRSSRANRSRERNWYFETWRRMVEDYSTRRLTLATDKLPAIAGLADAVQEVVKSDYLAGLWRDDLIAGMLWFKLPSRSCRGSVVHDFYYAPSWSWAWTDFPIRFVVRNDNYAEVLEVRTTSVGAKRRLKFVRLRTKAFDISCNEPYVQIYLDDGRTNNDVSGAMTVCILQTSLGRFGFGLILEPVESRLLCYKRVGMVANLRCELYENLEYQEITII